MDFLKFSTTIDFEGQKKAEKVFQIVISIFGFVGFICGYLAQSFAYTLLFTAVGVALSCLTVLPPWSFWNRNQLKWQKPIVSIGETLNADQTTKGSKFDSSLPVKKSDNKKSK